MISEDAIGMFKNLLTVAVGACFTVSALASDWAGFYGGVDIVHVEGRDAGKEYLVPGTVYDGWRQNVDVKGTGLGARAGYNWNLGGNFVAGLEASYRGYNAKDKAFQRVEATGGDCAPASDCVFTTKLLQSYSLVARLGYSFSDNLLVYGLGGYTRGQFNRAARDGWSANAGEYWYKSWQDGYVVGVGGEYAISKNLGASVEYRFSDFGKYKFFTPAFLGYVEKFNYRQDEVSVGLNYRF